MPRILKPGLAVAALALLSVGASCGDDDASSSNDVEPANGSGGEASSAPLPGVDLGDLARVEQRLFEEVVSDTLSPCGEPISVAQCVREQRDCSACLPAAKMARRLIISGYGEDEISERLNLRYGRDTEVQIPLGTNPPPPSKGAAMAPIVIVEFSDYECPYCGRAHPVLTRMLREFEGQVRLVFLHYPLDSHTHAAAAARAAVAAQNQGHFWEMTDLLFENQRALEAEDLERYAEELGLDMVRFRADLLAEETQARVEANKELGRSLEVAGTPTLFVNGRRFREDPEALPDYLREELEAMR